MLNIVTLRQKITIPSMMKVFLLQSKIKKVLKAESKANDLPVI